MHMRRPLFGNGIPRNIRLVNGEVTILDTEELDEGQVYALTLFLWNQQGGPGPFTNPAAVFRSYVNGGPAVVFQAATPAYLDSFFSAANGTRTEPVKVFDRFMMRGKQKLTIQVTAEGTPVQSCYLWGYFEMAGDGVEEVPFRGLQPSKLATPYTYPPTTLQLAANQIGVQATVHKLDPNYWDLVTLDLVHGGLGDGTFDWGLGVLLPGGVAVPQPSLSSLFPAPANGLYRYRIFDGIPMLALDATDAGSIIAIVGGVGPAPSLGMSAAAYGSFVRVS